MSQLETLETVGALGLLPHHVQDAVYQLGALGVVTLGPVVAGAGLAEHEVVGAEEGAVGAGPHAVHGAGLKVHEDSPGNVLAAGRLVVVDIDALQLQLGLALVGTGGVDTMLVTDENRLTIQVDKEHRTLPDDFPELSSDLVTALAGLDVDNFSHDDELDL